MKSRLVAVLMAVVLAACSALPTPQEAGADPMVHDGNAKVGIGKAIVVIPGALASVGMYAPVLDWDVPDSAVLAYRFPGLDGLKLDHRVDIEAAGELIADVVTRLAADEVYLIGFSTGGPIALEAARRLDKPKVSVALISTAGPFPSAVKASLKGFADVVQALFRSKSDAMEDAWLEHYRTLLYGRGHFTEAEAAERSKRLAEMQRGHLRVPRRRMVLAHTSSLMTWTMPRAPELADMRIAVFHGAEDSIFSLPQTRKFAGRIPADGIRVYDGQGHLLFVTAPGLWDDIRGFFGLSGRG